MSAQLLSADAPSGDDYMIVDLTAANGVRFEGLLHSQELSNARYNTDEYKSNKLVLRKIPKWADRASLPNAASLGSAGYPTGHSSYSSTSPSNPPTNWVTKADFYMGIFPVTQAQYKKVIGALPSKCAYTDQTNSPVNYVQWNTLRVSAAPDARFPTITKIQGSFLQCLNYCAGNKHWFDLPTLIMSEIAARAGSTARYWWGDERVATYVWDKSNANSTQYNVGEKPANAWGFYEVCGNGYEWCLDDGSRVSNLASAPSPFSPASASGSNAYRPVRNGGGIGAYVATQNLHDASSVSASSTYTNESRITNVGLRVAVIME